jgi:hypothetical protein
MPIFFAEKWQKIAENCDHYIDPWDRCYDLDFLRFFTIFGEKIGVFLKNQCYI